MSQNIQNSATATFRKLSLATAVSSCLVLAACGSGTDPQALLSNDPNSIVSDVSVRVDLPARIVALNEPMIVQGTVSGQTSNLTTSNDQEFRGDYNLPFNIEHTIHLSVRRQSDNLLLGTAEQKVLASNTSVPVYFPETMINVNIDSDGDGFSNIQELEDGSDPSGRNGDYDGDGTPDSVDTDDDNDGVPDSSDLFPYNANESVDTDLDGTGNNSDPDDDNDGVDDNLDRFPRDPSESVDTDGDGIGNNADPDDDNDGISDDNDINPLDAQSAFDTDGDGIGDAVDTDDDNDGVNDINDRFPLDDSESLDTDSDGIGNNEDTDDDNDDTHDLADPQPLNPNITGREDSDGDGVPDIEDAFPLDRFEFNDLDGDGIGNNADNDDNGNGIPDTQEDALVVIPRVNQAPTIDGVFGWSEWRNAVRCDSKGNYIGIGHLLIDANGDEAEQNSWNSSNWRAMHDGQYLYILVTVYNEPFYERFNESTDAWQDDSVEIYIDAGNEAAQTYDNNDFQKVFTFAGNSDAGSDSASRMRTLFRTSMATDTSAQDRSIYEIRIDMNSIGLPIGSRFGVDVHINDDDDGGDRDTKWAWYAPNGDDSSWLNPSLFGQAILAPGAVNID